METFRYLPDVATLHLNAEACVGCGMCTTVCPHGVLRMDGATAQVVDRNGCMECGACATNCPVDAIDVAPGVGCVAYIIQTWIKGKEKAACGGSECC